MPQERIELSYQVYEARVIPLYDCGKMTGRRYLLASSLRTHGFPNGGRDSEMTESKGVEPSRLAPWPV